MCARVRVHMCVLHAVPKTCSHQYALLVRLYYTHFKKLAVDPIAFLEEQCEVKRKCQGFGFHRTDAAFFHSNGTGQMGY